MKMQYKTGYSVLLHSNIPIYFEQFTHYI